ncbi:MAG TPA: hypothetical protein VFG42_00330 [Baekduia sp.]|uniref:hypothetical protein n=1 Tax=Baekduia sp. TaxID=2600305 RepID=UPI002D7745FB|nr:hypothetical protein [Baekduia sp.]HET6505205.1 hypothetical protein [Baekduia sp.]
MTPERRTRTTRRELLLAAAAAAALAAGCGSQDPPGSTLRRTLVDPDGDGLLSPGPGLPLRDRTELAPRAATGATLATIAQMSDLHVRDAQSPGRVAFLDRLGPRLGSVFRWHETLTAHVVAATVEAVNDAGADAVLVTGDLADSAQRNELAWSIALLDGAVVRPDSGAPGYRGVQEATIPDPFYYRPDVDAPRHPGLLARAVAPLRSPGLKAPWHAVLGNHDILVAGEVAPTAATRAAATGDRLLVTPSDALLRSLVDAAPTREQIDALLAAGPAGAAITVPRDPDRTQLGAADVLARLGGGNGASGRLDRTVAVGDRVLVVVLDVVRRDAGAGGLAVPETLDFLRRALAAAGDRAVLVAVHQPLDQTAGGASIRDVLDADPRVLAVLAGHTHRNAIAPRRTRAGGYWEITTCSVVDWPQQWRTLHVAETRGGGLVVETWMNDHTGRPNDEGSLAGVARDLAFLDPQGGRPVHAAGPPAARNVRLLLGRRRLAPPRTPGIPRALPPATAPGRLGAGDTPG